MNASRQFAGTFLLFVVAIVMSGCASIGAPVPPSLELPKPPTDLRAIRKGNKVYLSWSVPTKTTEHQNVRRPGPTRVCRSLSSMMSQCDVPVGNVEPSKLGTQPGHAGANEKLRAEFVDTLPADSQQQNATGMATYAVEPLNLDARSAGLSNQVQVPLAPTLPPPGNIKAQVLYDGVVLTWDCQQPQAASSNIRYTYRVYRRSADSSADTKLADVECPDSRYEDHTIEWQKSYEYRVTIVTSAKLENGVGPCPRNASDDNVLLSNCIHIAEIEGDDSPPTKVFTNDIFPPAVPTGLQAVFSGPGQPVFIDLVWAPDTDADLAGYNIFRREDNGPAQKINSELVKSPAYRDTNLSPGTTYFYVVSAIDLRGNESARSEEASETVPRN